MSRHTSTLGFAYVLRLADHGSGPACASHADRFPKGRDAQGRLTVNCG